MCKGLIKTPIIIKITESLFKQTLEIKNLFSKKLCQRQSDQQELHKVVTDTQKQIHTENIRNKIHQRFKQH